MRQLLKQFDKILFKGFLIKILRKFNTKKKQQLYNRYTTSIHQLRQYKHLTYWNNLFNHLLINNVKGDIVECGVGNGETLSYILFNLTYNQKFSDKNYIGFDSFEGFPEPSIHDKGPDTFTESGILIETKKGQWNHINEKFVLNNLQDLGFNLEDFEKVKFKKGFYENIFSNEYKNINKISLLHVDCDLYSSTKISLETWFSKVEKNGIVVFDEYLDSIRRFPGATKAINDFLGEDKKNIKICPFTKKYYFIK